MFFVNLKQQFNNKDIFNYKTILLTKVFVEASRKKCEIAQCTCCPRYGHTKGHCQQTSRCIKCTENHLTSGCASKTRSDKVKYVLCNEYEISQLTIKAVPFTKICKIKLFHNYFNGKKTL